MKLNSFETLKGTGVVFDVGDTLVNVKQLRRKALLNLLEGYPDIERNNITEGIIRDFDKIAERKRYNNFMFGLPAKTFEKTVRTYLRINQVAALIFSSRYRQEVRDLLRPNSTIISMLVNLKAYGAKIGVLSDGTTEEMSDSIRLIGVAKYCDAIGISQMIRAVKPEKRTFDWMSRALELSPNKLIMIGDDPYCDIQGAISACWKAVWINGDSNKVPEGVRCLQSSQLETIPMLMAEIFRENQ